MRLTQLRELGRIAVNSPWKVTNELRRVATLPLIRIGFAINGILWGKGWRIFGMPIIQRHYGSRIEFGDNLELRSWYSTNPLVPNHPVVFATRSAEAVIRVGNHCRFTGVTAVAAERIEVGNWVMVGANTMITDTDFHPLNPQERAENPLGGEHCPIVIGDHVFIGMSSIILKGVTLGSNSIVGAGSVVSRDVPSGAVVAGNPAQIVREVRE